MQAYDPDLHWGRLPGPTALLSARERPVQFAVAVAAAVGRIARFENLVYRAILTMSCVHFSVQK